MSPHPKEIRRARPLLGTFVEIVIPEADGNCDEAIQAGFGAVEEVQRRMSFHDPASTLSLINREAGSRAVPVDVWTYKVLQAAQEMHRVSGGLFDVTAARRLQRLGFLPGKGAAECGGDFRDIELTGDREVRLHHPAVQIDLGGIAKGFAVDQAVAALRAAGVASALVNAGGDLRAFGDSAFPIGIRHPDDPREYLTTFALRHRALATSAHYFAGAGGADAAVSPIVHPRSDQPPALPLSVTVRAESALIADALTKVVMLSPESALEVLAQFDAEALFVNAAGQMVSSPGWSERRETPPID